MTRRGVQAWPKQYQKASEDRDEPPLEAARRADADQLTHEEPQIEAAGVDQESLADVRVAAEMHAAQAPMHRSVGIVQLLL